VGKASNCPRRAAARGPRLFSCRHGTWDSRGGLAAHVRPILA
jgi:hypothetical protein